METGSVVIVSPGETALKSRVVRSFLGKMLLEQVRFTLSKAGFKDFAIENSQGRLYTYLTETANAVQFLCKLFGVTHVIPATKIGPERAEISQHVVREASRILGPGQSFAIRPKVVGSQTYTGRELAYSLGSDVLHALSSREISVNLDKPDRTIYVEVRQEGVFVYSEILDGPGGYPYGSQGRLISLFSGGIDSPVATWMMMKRGASVIPVFLDQRPYTSEEYYCRAVEAAKTIRGFVPLANYSLRIVEFGPVMERIMQCRNPRLRCVLCKRAMYRVASEFAFRAGARGFITGESLGQVASQTLDNLLVLSEAASVPVYRPLIGLDKVEIQEKARKIGTYEVTAKDVGGCKAVPSKPKTKSRSEEVASLERELDLLRCLEYSRLKISKVQL